MDYYHYSVELPFSKKVIKFREFTTEEQLALGKAQHSFSNDLSTYYTFVYNIISKCVSEDSKFESLDVIEYILFLIKIRIISVGPKIELSTVVEEQNAKITIDLNHLMQRIYDTVEEILKDFVIDSNKKIKMGFPKILDMPEFVSISTDLFTVLNTIPLFINKAGIVTNHRDMKKVYSQLPVSLSNAIQSKVFDTLKILAEKEIFSMEIFQGFRINFYNNSIFELIKILSSYDVKTIHQEIYLLSQLTPAYIKSITPSERKIYMSFFLQERAPKDKGEPNIPQGRNLSPVDALAAEFGQEPLNLETPPVNS